MARRIYSSLPILERIVLPLSIALLVLHLPRTSFADIENLYAEGYSSSVDITNPSNAYGAPAGHHGRHHLRAPLHGVPYQEASTPYDNGS